MKFQHLINFFFCFLFFPFSETRILMKPRTDRAGLFRKQYNFVCDCIACKMDFSPSKVTGKQTLDGLSCRLLAIMKDFPEHNVLVPISRDEMRLYEKVAVNYLRQNDHLRPSIEILKIQFLLLQIWYLLIHYHSIFLFTIQCRIIGRPNAHVSHLFRIYIFVCFLIFACEFSYCSFYI